MVTWLGLHFHAGSQFAYAFSQSLDTDHWFIEAFVIVISVQKAGTSNHFCSYYVIDKR
jgi:hypothetical protein